jgi:hypothetical protein
VVGSTRKHALRVVQLVVHLDILVVSVGLVHVIPGICVVVVSTRSLGIGLQYGGFLVYLGIPIKCRLPVDRMQLITLGPCRLWDST